ncbi:MAG TPA: hypothetical protein VF683_02060 [Chthoniobacterales bacterium]
MNVEDVDRVTAVSNDRRLPVIGRDSDFVRIRAGLRARQFSTVAQIDKADGVFTSDGVFTFVTDDERARSARIGNEAQNGQS